MNYSELPDDVARFLEGMTNYRIETSAPIHELGLELREEAQHAAELCDKYGVTYVRRYGFNFEDGELGLEEPELDKLVEVNTGQVVYWRLADQM